MFLESSLFKLRPPLYRPQILCVGDVYKWKVGVWQKNHNSYSKVEGPRKEQLLRKYHYGYKVDPKGYVASIGTCSGDSGGPLYMTQFDKSFKEQYVVTGTFLTSYFY